MNAALLLLLFRMGSTGSQTDPIIGQRTEIIGSSEYRTEVFGSEGVRLATVGN